MVGLIYKDLCCLRKHIKMFATLTAVVIALSLLFVLSATLPCSILNTNNIESAMTTTVNVENILICFLRQHKSL